MKLHRLSVISIFLVVGICGFLFSSTLRPATVYAQTSQVTCADGETVELQNGQTIDEACTSSCNKEKNSRFMGILPKMVQVFKDYSGTAYKL